jgi:hypothetical protein
VSEPIRDPDPESPDEEPEVDGVELHDVGGESETTRVLVLTEKVWLPQSEPHLVPADEAGCTGDEST